MKIEYDEDTWYLELNREEAASLRTIVAGWRRTSEEAGWLPKATETTVFLDQFATELPQTP